MVAIIATDAWNKQAGAYDIVAFVMTFIFLIMFINQFYCKKQQGQIIWAMKIAFIAYIFFYCMRYAQATIYFILFPDHKYSDTADHIDEIIGATGFIVAHICFYIIMLLRLYYAFRDTYFQIKTFELISYIIAELLIFSLNISIYIIDQAYYALFALTFLNLIIGFALIWSFTQRLFQLVVRQISWFRQHSDSGLTSFCPL